MTRATDVAVLVTVVFGFSLNAQSRPQLTPQTLAQFSASIEDLARASGPAVVQISVQGRSPIEEGGVQGAGFTAEQRTTGSGVIVDPDGYIVTNAHVVIDARHIDISVIDGGQSGQPGKRKHLPATTVGLDRETDLAVLKIEAKGLPTLSFRDDSESLKQGQLVLALGSPLGLDNSLTVGFVSAPVRHLSPDKPNYYIQTDAPINPGNSGGPLLDIAGHIAGINTMIMSQSGGSEGIGFAIPSNIVRRTYQGLRKDGRIRRGAIGVVPQDITPTLASALGLDRDSGIILSDIVPHGAAEASGLEPGDIVLAVDGKPIEQSRQLMAVVFQHVFGEEITLDVQRGKERLQKTVAVLARPRSPEDLEELASRDAHLIRRLGVLALTLDERVTPILPDLRRLSGVVVAAIPAEFAGLNPGLIAGDAIYELNGSRIGTLEELRTALDGKKTGDPIALLIERSGQLVYVSFELE
ncbi:MAG: trypsin-like peptidase domain-containing protein [Bryobacteraceae bacterium]|jgi:serine protease Do